MLHKIITANVMQNLFVYLLKNNKCSIQNFVQGSSVGRWVWLWQYHQMWQTTLAVIVLEREYRKTATMQQYRYYYRITAATDDGSFSLLFLSP